MRRVGMGAPVQKTVEQLLEEAKNELEKAKAENEKLKEQIQKQTKSETKKE